MIEEEPYVQLQMVWPDDRLADPPEAAFPDGYEARVFRDPDEPAYLALMHAAGFKSWGPDQMADTRCSILPDGHFVIAERDTGDLASTAMARHRPTDLHPFGGELSWVATHPEHRGRGLGRAVCAAVTARLIAAGYSRIYLSTDDWRLPAIQLYLSLGYEPLLFCEGMAERWQKICEQIG